MEVSCHTNFVFYVLALVPVFHQGIYPKRISGVSFPFLCSLLQKERSGRAGSFLVVQRSGSH